MAWARRRPFDATLRFSTLRKHLAAIMAASRMNGRASESSSVTLRYSRPARRIQWSDASMLPDLPGGQGRLAVGDGRPLRRRVHGALCLLEEERFGPLELSGVEGPDGRLEQGGLPVLDLEVEVDRIGRVLRIVLPGQVRAGRVAGGPQPRPIGRGYDRHLGRSGDGTVLGQGGLFDQGLVEGRDELERPDGDLGAVVIHR